jgi:hypothetical protein
VQKTLEKLARSISGYAVRRLSDGFMSMRPSFLDCKQQQGVKRGLFVLRFVFQVAWIA